MQKLKIILSVLLFSHLSFAQDENPFKNLDYPELQVAPRASERLQQMAKAEGESMFVNQWPLLTSGVATLTAGLMAKNSPPSWVDDASEERDAEMASNAAIGIGAAWILVGSYLSMKKPMASAVTEVRKLPASDKRSELGKERAAEEHLENTARVQTTLDRLAMVTNLSASIYVTAMSEGDARVYGYLAIAASFLPWAFPTLYETNYEKHLEYKRKIYAPLVNLDLHPSGRPQVNLSWSF